MVESRGNHLRQSAHIGLSQQDPAMERFVGTLIKEQGYDALGREAVRISRAGIFKDRSYAFLGGDSKGDIVVRGGAVLSVSTYNSAQDIFDKDRLGPRLSIIIEKEGENDELKKFMGKKSFLAIPGIIKGISINIDSHSVSFGNVRILSVREDKASGRRESAGTIQGKYVKSVYRNNARNLAPLLMDLIESSEQYQQLQAQAPVAAI